MKEKEATEVLVLGAVSAKENGAIVLLSGSKGGWRSTLMSERESPPKEVRFRFQIGYFSL